MTTLRDFLKPMSYFGPWLAIGLALGLTAGR